ncbi:MAG: trigger factor family protein [Bacteroidales bacterium]|nr:trigger factor family protein [Bacteroidales bacterium]
MEITKNQIDKLNLELTLQVAQDDYASIQKKKTSERRRTADFKGFRKGMVPVSLIQKVFGEQILVESVNEVVSKALDEYITTNGLHLLGEPLASEKQPEIDWKTAGNFTFIFDAALTPEFSVAVEAADTVLKYQITVAAKDKEKMVENLKKYYADKKEEKPEEEIEKEVTGRMQNEYKQESEWRLSKDIRAFYVAKAGIELPEAFLKRWLYAANGGKYSKEDIEKEFAGFAEDFKWQLVRGFLMKQYGFKVEEQDIREAAKAFVTYQYAMYGLPEIPGQLLDETVGNILNDPKQIERLSEQVEDRKVLDKIKETITLKDKKISAEKFRELA